MKENKDKFLLERILESVDMIDKHLLGFELDSF